MSAIARKVALEGLRTAYENLCSVVGTDCAQCELIGAARGHVLWSLGALGTDADREYVRAKNRELEASLEADRLEEGT